jgi:hypothetical protein
VDVFGKEIKREMPYSAVASTTTQTNDPTEAELERLGISPGMPREFIMEGKEKKDIPRGVYTAWVKQYGPQFKADLDALIQSPGYGMLSDDGKESAINKVFNKHYRSRKELLQLMMKER